MPGVWAGQGLAPAPALFAPRPSLAGVSPGELKVGGRGPGPGPWGLEPRRPPIPAGHRARSLPTRGHKVPFRKDREVRPGARLRGGPAGGHLPGDASTGPRPPVATAALGAPVPHVRRCVCVSPRDQAQSPAWQHRRARGRPAASPQGQGTCLSHRIGPGLTRPGAPERAQDTC